MHGEFAVDQMVVIIFVAIYDPLFFVVIPGPYGLLKPQVPDEFEA